MKNSRYLGALILAPLLCIVFLGGNFLKYTLMVISIAGIYEFYNVCRKRKYNPVFLAGYLFCVLYYVFLSNRINYHLFFLTLGLIVMILLCIPVFSNKYNFIDIAITVLGFVYIPFFFSLIYMTSTVTYGKYLVWLIFISAFVCDIAAYYTGRFFGKHKLCQRVSPKKTIEGSIGGLIGSLLCCSIFGAVIIHYNVKIDIIHFFIIGFICGIICQLGDLCASSIKRFCDVKDYSNLIPGHGGILDRFDSILFTSMTVYYYVTFILGL